MALWHYGTIQQVLPLFLTFENNLETNSRKSCFASLFFVSLHCLRDEGMGAGKEFWGLQKNMGDDIAVGLGLNTPLRLQRECVA